MIRAELLFYYHPIYDPMSKQIKPLMIPNILTFDEFVVGSSSNKLFILSSSPESQPSSLILASKSHPLVDRVELEKLSVESIILQNAPDHLTISDICEANVSSITFLPIIPRLPWDNPELCPPTHLLKSRMSVPGIWNTRIKLMRGTTSTNNNNSSTLTSSISFNSTSSTSSNNQNNNNSNNSNNSYNNSSTPPSSYEVFSSQESSFSSLSQSPPASPIISGSQGIPTLKIFEDSPLRPSRRSIIQHTSLKLPSSFSFAFTSSSQLQLQLQLQSENQLSQLTQSQLTQSQPTSELLTINSELDPPKSPVNNGDIFLNKKETISPPFQRSISSDSNNCSKVISPEMDRLASVSEGMNNVDKISTIPTISSTIIGGKSKFNETSINNGNDNDNVDNGADDSQIIQKKRKLPEVVSISVNKSKGKKNKTILVASIKSYFT